MLPPYKPRRPFDAKLVYDTWLTLVAEEPLYDAMQRGEHAAVARRLGLSEEQLLILDDFADQAGTRWHIENLRFRCTTMVGRILKWHLPATMWLLTRGSNDWLRDLAYEYMAHSRWQDYGHHNRGPECRRFAAFVRQRIMKRRRPPEHLEAVLSYELGVLELVQRALQLPVAEWPAPLSADVAIDTMSPRLSPVARIFELPVDMVGWLSKPEGELRIDGPGPVYALSWVPSAAELPRSVRLDATEHALLAACDGVRTVAELSADVPAHAALLRAWLSKGTLAPSIPAQPAG